jgi:hypothetical protein
MLDLNDLVVCDRMAGLGMGLACDAISLIGDDGVGNTADFRIPRRGCTRRLRKVDDGNDDQSQNDDGEAGSQTEDCRFRHEDVGVRTGAGVRYYCSGLGLPGTGR